MRQAACRTAVVALALQAVAVSSAGAAPVTWAANGHVYDPVLVASGIGWFDAQRAVEARGCGWYLATLTSAAEDDFVFGLIKTRPEFFNFGNGPWLGGLQRNSRDEDAGNWRWVTAERFVYTDWGKGEPSNNTAGRQEVEPGVPKGLYETFLSHKGNGTWNDHHPNALFKGYVAEFDKAERTRCRAAGGQDAASVVTWATSGGGNGHKYEAVAVPAGIGWVEAKLAAARKGCGWYLATPTTAAEDRFIYALVAGRPEFFVSTIYGPWIGGYQRDSRAEPRGGWRWVLPDGAFTYTNWAPGEPANSTKGNPAAEPGIKAGQSQEVLEYQAGGRWRDGNVTAQARGYIAEFDEARRQACLK